VQLLLSSDPEVAITTSVALRNLTTGPYSCKAAIVAGGGIPAILQLLRVGATGSHPAAEHAVAALFNLTENASSRGMTAEALDAAGGVPALVQLLGRGHSSGALQRSTAWVLGNLAQSSAGMRADVVAAGGLAALQQLCSSKTAFHQSVASVLEELAPAGSAGGNQYQVSGQVSVLGVGQCPGSALRS